MAKPTDLPVWVPAIIGVVLVVGVGAPFVQRYVDGAPRSGAAAPSTAPATRRAPASPGDMPAANAELPRLRFTAVALGAPGVSHFAFDPGVPGRVVSCGGESRDGGRTWARLEAAPSRPTMILSEPAGAPPVPGPDGRILCGAVILPDDSTTPGRGARPAAAEWTGVEWRGVAMPPLSPAALAPLDTAATPAAAVGYAPDGEPFAVHGDRLLQAAHASRLQGAVSAWAMGRDGAAYASIRMPGRRPHLAWAPAVSAAWQEVPTPGDVFALAADGETAYAAAEMLGRGRHDTWHWTRWPANVVVRGLTVSGATLVAWGTVPDDGRGRYVVSRDGGVTLQLAIHGGRLAWAALDPHQPAELLVLGEDGALARLRIE